MNHDHSAAVHRGQRGFPVPDLDLAIRALLSEAMRHHQAGRLAEAEQRYRKILVIDARHADSLHLLGVVASQHGRHADAIDLIGRAIRLRNAVPHYHVNLGNAFRAEGRLAKAVASYQRALSLRPDFAEALCNLAGVLRKQNRLAEAVELFERAVALQPTIAEIHNDLASALRDQGKLAEAVTHCERALALRPDYAQAHDNLGAALQDQGRLTEAVAHHERALALKPDFPEAHNNLGHARKQQNRLADAVAHYQSALALRPDYAEAHNNLGIALKDQGKPDEAVAHYQRALALRPDYAEAHSNLAIVLSENGTLADAVAHYERALAIRPDLSEVHYNLGNALQEQGKLTEAVAHYERAIALRPDHAEAHNNLGNTWLDQGRIEDAQRAYRTAIELAPRAGRHYRHLFDMRRIVAGDPHFAAAESLAREMSALPLADQKELHFALGKACADLDLPERAFHHFLEGNALRRRELAYDETQTLGLFDRIRALFTPELMRAMRGSGDPATRPIFIVGMPRSGTTLIEQILATHPKVFAAGELEDFQLAVAGLSARNEAPPFPEIVPELSGEALRQLGAKYLATVGVQARGAARIVDKMPGNFHFAGLIHLALPNVRIVHIRRDPVDTCLSCFMRLFRTGQPYSYDLEELGRYYRAYDALMRHWNRVLPAGVMLEVRYEDVVADVEGQARRLVAHCGLEWDATVLHFHLTRRPVRTASAMQVRQPVYSTSVGRWRAYRDLLRPLISELGVTDEA